VNQSIYDIPINSIDGDENILAELKGKVTLFFPFASKAGYEPKCSRIWSYARTARNLWELQKLHEMFDGFNVVGIPTNQFWNMEPLGNQEISKFIKDVYPFVTFPITEKIVINGDDEHPVASHLKGYVKRLVDDTKAGGGLNATQGQNLAGGAMHKIPANYEKFIVNKDGRQMHRFRFSVRPLSEVLEASDMNMTVIQAVQSLL
jgi:glutathione peroxidase